MGMDGNGPAVAEGNGADRKGSEGTWSGMDRQEMKNAAGPARLTAFVNNKQ